MSDASSSRWLTRSPRQASKVFATGPYYAKQHHEFAIKFVVNGASVGADADTITNLTFVAKMVDRPKVDPKTEELHQYNKRRQVYTGLNYQPMRIQFYDDAHGRALRMWQDYSSYYFGDFKLGANNAYKADVVESDFDSSGTGFGLISPGGGSGDVSGGQYYFHEITIYHLFNKAMDVYHLTNPRISLFEPDDLNYEESSVSMISMSIVYENLQYELQSTTGLDEDDEIFATGKPFDGDIMPVSDGNAAPREFKLAATQFTAGDARKSLPTSKFAPAVGSLHSDKQFRYPGTPATGSLGLFGQYSFGAHFTPGVTRDNYLWATALNNIPLAASLNMGLAGTPLELTSVSMAGAANMSTRGIDGAAYDIALATASEGSTGYGDTVDEVVTGMLASNAIRGDSSVRTQTGITLTPESYGVMNSRQTGTAQYGFNQNSAPDGSSWGYTGPAGYQGPYGNYNDGPYTADRPAGISGRAGIAPEPLADYNDTPAFIPDYNDSPPLLNNTPTVPDYN